MAKRLNRWFLGALGISAAALGCSDLLEYDSVGFEDPAGPSQTPDRIPAQCGGVPAGSSACASCIDANCCVFAMTCGQDAACEDLMACRSSCQKGDKSCLDACVAKHEQGTSSYGSLQACVSTSCAAACLGEPGPGSEGAAGMGGGTSEPSLPAPGGEGGIGGGAEGGVGGAAGAAGGAAGGAAEGGSPPAPATCDGDCDLGKYTACTCGAADPCGWMGDGYCDDACSNSFASDHFDDASDCSSGGGGSGGSSGTGGTSGSGGSTSGGNDVDGHVCSMTESGGTGSESGGVIPICCAPTDADRALIDEVFQLLNQHRAANGVSQLSYDSSLEAAIQGHCVHMSTHDFFDHSAPEAVVSSPWARAELCGTSAGGENIAAGYTSAASVMEGWTNSPGHNQNMLSGNFSRVGIGFADGYWGQLFGW